MNTISFDPIPRSRLYEQIVEKIKAMIAAGQIKPGECLPSERELAQNMRVSRVPVREALKMLEFMGIIEVHHGRGAVVQGLGRASMLEVIDLVLESDSDTLTDLTEARLVLETGAVSMACARRTEDDLKRMREALAKMEAAINQGEKGVDASMEFHMALMRATKNKVLYRFMILFSDLLRESRELSLDRPGRPAEALAEHRQILAAVADRDVGVAVATMEAHLSQKA